MFSNLKFKSLDIQVTQRPRSSSPRQTDDEGQIMAQFTPNNDGQLILKDLDGTIVLQQPYDVFIPRGAIESQYSLRHRFEVAEAVQKIPTSDGELKNILMVSNTSALQHSIAEETPEDLVKSAFINLLHQTITQGFGVEIQRRTRRANRFFSPERNVLNDVVTQAATASSLPT